MKKDVSSNFYYWFLLFFLSAQCVSVHAQSGIHRSVLSPDDRLKFVLLGENNENSQLQLFYKVHYRDKEVIRKSSLDLSLDNHLSELAMAIEPDEGHCFSGDLELVSQKDTSVNSQWDNSFGERSVVTDHYNQTSFLFEKRSKKGYQMRIDVRAYNEGIAFRYHFPLNQKGLYYRVLEEETEFRLPEASKAWFHRWTQAPYELLPLENWIDESERPLTCELPNDLFVTITEARMVNYSRMKFKIRENKPGVLVTSLYTPVDAITPFSTPWRVVMVAEQPGSLLENNDILLNLNAPCVFADKDWIKPGKIMREVAQTNENTRAQIDFSAENGIDYLLYDWKWYGPAFEFSSDASTVDIDLDLHRWIEYGNEKGVGIWVYVNQQALLTQMREIFPLYKKWGIKGVKFGFVQVGSHRWTTWLHEAIQLAADNELMVNIHDEFRTSGETRTWPNIVTVEGIRGNEEFPDATHNTVLPFTRFVGGLGDYTICYMDNRLKTSHAHQLALGVVYFSPLQTIYWYDRPGELKNVPETEFFRQLPTVWDDTKVLEGRIGEFAVVARKRKEDWFLGAITNTEKRKLELNLDFLSEGKNYQAHIYSDNENSISPTKVGVETKIVSHQTMLDMSLKSSGGVAIWFESTD